VVHVQFNAVKHSGSDLASEEARGRKRKENGSESDWERRKQSHESLKTCRRFNWGVSQPPPLGGGGKETAIRGKRKRRKHKGFQKACSGSKEISQPKGQEEKREKSKKTSRRNRGASGTVKGAERSTRRKRERWKTNKRKTP